MGNAISVDNWLNEKLREAPEPDARDLLPLWRFPHAHSAFPCRRGIRGWRKRAIDLVCSIAVLIFISPILLAIAFAIKLDSPGPVLFRQSRFGRDMRPFQIYKFRTMTHTPEGGSVMQASRADKRITRVGGFLRRSSLDELAQIFNVLKGDMSLVGPRPHAMAHDHVFAKVFAPYVLRFRVKPGITGLAQIRGARGEIRTENDVVRRAQGDLDYQRKWTALLDIYIIVITPFVVLKHFLSKESY